MSRVVVVLAFNPRQRQVDLCEFKASLVYRASARIDSKATQRYPVSKNKETKVRKT